MSRAYVCHRCGETRATDAKRGPVPRICDPCKILIGQPRPEPTVTLAEARQMAADAAAAAMVPSVPPGAVSTDDGYIVLQQGQTPQLVPAAAFIDPAAAPAAPLPAGPPPPLPEPPPYRPGFLETTLRAELDAMTSTNPAAKTLAASALQIARAADRADPDDIRQVIAANKELRAVLADLSRSQPAGGDDDDEGSIFGPVRAEVVNAPTV